MNKKSSLLILSLIVLLAANILISISEGSSLSSQINTEVTQAVPTEETASSPLRLIKVVLAYDESIPNWLQKKLPDLLIEEKKHDGYVCSSVLTDMNEISLSGLLTMKPTLKTCELSSYYIHDKQHSFTIKATKDNSESCVVDNKITVTYEMAYCKPQGENLFCEKEGVSVLINNESVSFSAAEVFLPKHRLWIEETLNELELSGKIPNTIQAGQNYLINK